MIRNFFKKLSWKSWLFLLIVAMLVFESPIESVWEPFSYLDEVFGLLFFPLLLLRVVRRRAWPRLTRRQWVMVALLGVVLLTGFAGYLINRYQPLWNTLCDAYINVKFYLAIGVGYMLFEECDFERLEREIYPGLNLITLVLFVLCLFDLVFQVYPSESRWGLRAIQLFYNSKTTLVAEGVFLSALYLRISEYKKMQVLPWLGMLCFIILWTLRFKAICAVFCILLLWWLICRRGKKLTPLTWGVLGGGVVAIGLPQMLFYFYKGMQEYYARPILTLASFYVGADYFPFGTGWATYGSYFSISPFSPVYEMYQLNQIWGLSEEYSQYIADNFWPMILAQCGYIGLACYVAVVALLGLAVLRLGKKNVYAYASGLLAMLYLLICSTSESAFAGPVAIPFAFLLGFLFAEDGAERPAP